MEGENREEEEEEEHDAAPPPTPTATPEVALAAADEAGVRQTAATDGRNTGPCCCCCCCRAATGENGEENVARERLGIIVVVAPTAAGPAEGSPSNNAASKTVEAAAAAAEAEAEAEEGPNTCTSERGAKSTKKPSSCRLSASAWQPSMHKHTTYASQCTHARGVAVESVLCAPNIRCVCTQCLGTRTGGRGGEREKRKKGKRT